MKTLKVAIAALSVLMMLSFKQNGDDEPEVYRNVVFAEAPTANGGTKSLQHDRLPHIGFRPLYSSRSGTHRQAGVRTGGG